MATIGTLTRRPDGAFTGTLTIKSYGGKTFFRPVRKTSDAAPDFRLFGVGDGGHTFEMGAAWTKARKDGAGDYVSVKIDFPELANPIYATLGQMAGQDDPDVFAVIWNRPSENRGGGDPFAGLTAGAPGEDAVMDHDDPGNTPDGTNEAAPGDAFAGLDAEDVPSSGPPSGKAKRGGKVVAMTDA